MYIYEPGKNNEWSVGNFEIRSTFVVIYYVSSVSGQLSAYTSIYRGLEYPTLFSNRSEKLPCLKKYYKNEWHLCLVTHIFTKLLQERISCVLYYTYFDVIKCHDCKLWNASYTNGDHIHVCSVVWLYPHQAFINCVSGNIHILVCKNVRNDI